jgi:hypothetical protein
LRGLGNAIVFYKSLPILGQASKFACRWVEANMRDVKWVMRRADLRPFVGFDKVGHEAKHTLLAFGDGGAAMGAPCGTHAIWAWKKGGTFDGGSVGGGGFDGS